MLDTPAPAYRPQNLVLEGGGVLGAAELGAVLELRRLGYFNSPTPPFSSTLRRVIGTSAGSILAIPLALGASDAYLSHLAHSIPYSTFTDAYPGLVSLRLLRRFGIFKGDACLRWIESMIEDLGWPKSLTFGELNLIDKTGASPILPSLAGHTRANHCLDLYVTAYNLDRGRTITFSSTSTPDVRIADAVRASMSIPLFFASHKIAVNGSNDLYIDGGVTRNYPIRAFDNDGINLLTLGIRVDSKTERGEYRYTSPVKGLPGYVIRLVSAMHQATSGTHLDPCDWERTIWCDSLDIPATKFNITKTEVDLLLESGRQGVREWVKWGEEKERRESKQ